MPKVVSSTPNVGAANAGAVGWIGGYQLLAEIAEGDLAVVLAARARDASPESRPVAIHRYHEEIAADPEFRRLLAEELASVAMLAHPNVLAPREVIEAEPLSIVMDLLDGGSLAALIEHAREQSKRVPVPIVLRVMVDVLTGLHAAHEMFGIVHRGISPHAAFVGDDGVGRVTEIGLSLARSYAAASSERPIDEYAVYKAPEQFDSRPITAVADVYSSAEVLWEALAGRPRFGGGSVAASLKARAKIIPPSEVVPGLPGDIDGIVLKALENDPGGRFVTAAEFAHALSSCAVALASKDEVAAYVRTVLGGAMAKRRARWTTVQVAREQATAAGAGEVAANGSVSPRRLAENVSIANGASPEAAPGSAARAAWSASWEGEASPAADKTGARPAVGNKPFSPASGKHASAVRLPVPATTGTPSPSATRAPAAAAKETTSRTLAPPPHSTVLRGATRPGMPVPAPLAAGVTSATPAPTMTALRAPTPAPVASPVPAPTQLPVVTAPEPIADPLAARVAPMWDPPAALRDSALDAASLVVESAVDRSGPTVASVAPVAAPKPTPVAPLIEPAPSFGSPLVAPSSAFGSPVVVAHEVVAAAPVLAPPFAAPPVRQLVAASVPTSRTIIDGTPRSAPVESARVTAVLPAPPTVASIDTRLVRSQPGRKLPLFAAAAAAVAIVLAGGLWVTWRVSSQPSSRASTANIASTTGAPLPSAELPPTEPQTGVPTAAAPTPSPETGALVPVLDPVTGHRTGYGRLPASNLAPGAAPIVEPEAVPAAAPPPPRRRRREYRPGTV